MMQLWGITSSLHKREAKAQGGMLPGAQLPSVQPQSYASASLRWEKEERLWGHCITKVNSLSLQVSYWQS